MAWIVENFQVPVPLGDCSIHVLVKNRESVEYAFIMDGGVDSGDYSASNAIIMTLNYVNDYLKSKYRIEVKIKFNLWVVTHWDADHFRGVMDLIAKFEKKKENKKNKKKNEPPELPQSTRWMAENFVEGPMLYCGRLEEPFFSQASALGFGSVGGEMALGLDMLSGVKIFDKNGTPYPNDELEENRPRFCIVGANGCGIKVAKAQKNVNRNQSSILAVLFWPWNDGRCCFFAGGDGNPELERQIFRKFLKVSTIVRLDDSIDLMKLDHHGSSQENIYGGELREVKSKRKMKLANMPIGLFKPENFLVTPGNLHGHPTYDVVQCLLDLLGSTTGLMKDGRPFGRVWTTRSPYWATKKAPTAKDLSVYHNQDLKEIHEKDLQAYKDPTKKELEPGMLLAVEAKEGKSLTDYQVKKLANKELENMLKSVENNKPTMAVEEEQKADLTIQEEKVKEKEGEREEEAAASAQFDYEYVSYDDVMNLRFAAHEMWNLICDQGIVPISQDPFFIVHFRWVDALFRPVECLGMDGNPKDYKPEPSVPPRYSQRLWDIKEAKKQKIKELLVAKPKGSEIKEQSLVIPITKQDGLFYVEQDNNSFNDGNNQEKDQDSGTNLSMFEFSVPMVQYAHQAFVEQNTFTHISQSDDSTVRQNLTGTGWGGGGGFNTLQLGNMNFQTSLCPAASLSANENEILLLHGLTMGDINPTLKKDPRLAIWAAKSQFTFIQEVEVGSNLKCLLGGDSEESDEDFQAGDVEESQDEEDSATESSMEEEGDEDLALDDDWQNAWKASQPTADDWMNADGAKQRIQEAVNEMKKIKKKAEESVADIDPTLFTGNVDEASRARIEKLLVMAITYRPPAKPQAKAKKATAEKQKREARAKGINAKKQMQIKEEKNYNAKDKTALSKREWESGKFAGSDSETLETLKSTRKKQQGTNM
ncbi:hypothetical protein DER46DRAFT_664289 [Fusarium sp. MPI-SDFR-AT-0072]|nr:hypothetical protein DER46DRAFT_664289 [Fusarium sp. MPI-SDFR-AT-0072]